jgi:beta-lactamase superfamily II metal-dependent hydrolase
MKKLIIAAFTLIIAISVRADDLEKQIEAQKKVNDQLRLDLAPKAAPVLIHNADAAIDVSKNVFLEATRRFNAIPPAARDIRFQMTGGQKPNRREGGGFPFGCGWYAEIDGNRLSAVAHIPSLQAAWLNTELRMSASLSASGDVQVAGHANPPPCPRVSNCHLCFTPLPGICCDVSLSCDDHWCTGGGFGTTIHVAVGGSANLTSHVVAGSISPLARNILATLIDGGVSLTTAQVAALLGVAEPVVAAEMDRLTKAALVSGPPFTPAPIAVAARSQLGSLVTYEATVDPINVSANFTPDIQIPTPSGPISLPIFTVTLDKTLNVDKSSMGSVRLGNEFKGTLDIPSQLLTQDLRPLPNRNYDVSFGADQVSMTPFGVEARARVDAEWQDVKDLAPMLKVQYIDVGNGDAIFIQLPKRPDGSGGENILIDGGPWGDDPNTPEIENRVILALRTAGVRDGARIDYLVLTHPAPEHSNGLWDVLDRYEVATIIDSGRRGSDNHRAFIERAKKEMAGGLPARVIEHPVANSIQLSGTPVAEILYSDRPNAPLGRGLVRDKNASIVIRLTYGNHSYLFTGDAKGLRGRSPDPAYVEKILLDENRQKLGASVLKIADHGERESSGTSFLEAVAPRAVVISAGVWPIDLWARRRMPDPETLARIHAVAPTAAVVATNWDDLSQRRDRFTTADGDDVLAISDGATIHLFQSHITPTGASWQPVTTIP